MRHVIAAIDELPPGQKRIVLVEGREVGLFNVQGRFYAVRNVCPHQGAPLCLGEIDGTMLPSNPQEYRWGREGEILRCPWHGWEFDLRTGLSLCDARIRVKVYLVEVEGDQLVLEI